MNTMRRNVKRYLKTLEKIKSDNTVLSYGQDLFQFCRFLESSCQGRPAADGDILGYVDYIKETRSTASVVKKLSVLNGFFNYMILSGEMETNPLEGVQVPKVERGQTRVTPREELKKLSHIPKGYSAMAVRDRAMLSVMADTGYTAGRIVELDMEDYRSLKLSKAVVRILIDYIYGSRPELVGNKGCTKMFLNYNGLPLSRQGLRKIIRSYQERVKDGTI